MRGKELKDQLRKHGQLLQLWLELMNVVAISVDHNEDDDLNILIDSTEQLYGKAPQYIEVLRGDGDPPEQIEEICTRLANCELTEDDVVKIIEAMNIMYILTMKSRIGASRLMDVVESCFTTGEMVAVTMDRILKMTEPQGG